jgi:hypothetical protein
MAQSTEPSMTRLTNRLARLEREAGGGNCPACKGLGRAGYSFRFSTEPEPAPMGGCPRCGRCSEVISKVVEMAGDFNVNAAFPPVRIPCT